MVYVLNKNQETLMPCSNVIARLLLKQGKAKVKRKIPFTIILNYDSSEYVQDLTLGIDTGSSKIGSAVVSDNGEVLYISEVETRNDITGKMEQRAKYRRSRRNRKTRYRKARFLNRKNSIKKNRFSPTMVSKINSHIKEILYVKSILPIKDLILETGNFDPHLMKNPKLYNELYKRFGYTKGINYGFANTKAYVLNRDNYTCQYCKGKHKDSKLEVHHIIFRSQGGSDEENNLICLCKTCHDKLHKGLINLNKKGKIKSNLKHATQMNSIRVQLLRLFECEETFGYITKENRQNLNLPKEHYIDAVVIASRGKEVVFKTNTLILKKCIPYRDYQKTKGIRSEQYIPTGKIFGFRKFDKVLYLNEEFFIKGRMSTGYAILMKIDGGKVPLNPIPKFSKMKRIVARKSWIISLKTIQNI